jgi:hypothetical protein
MCLSQVTTNKNLRGTYGDLILRRLNQLHRIGDSWYSIHCEVCQIILRKSMSLENGSLTIYTQDESTPVGPAESSGSTPRYAVMMCTMTLGFWSAIVKIFICVLTLPQFCWLPLLLGWRVVTIIVLTQNFTSWLCCHGNFLTNYPPTIPDASHSA